MLASARIISSREQTVRSILRCFTFSLFIQCAACLEAIHTPAFCSRHLVLVAALVSQPTSIQLVQTKSSDRQYFTAGSSSYASAVSSPQAWVRPQPCPWEAQCPGWISSVPPFSCPPFSRGAFDVLPPWSARQHLLPVLRLRLVVEPSEQCQTKKILQFDVSPQTSALVVSARDTFGDLLRRTSPWASLGSPRPVFNREASVRRLGGRR